VTIYQDVAIDHSESDRAKGMKRCCVSNEMGDREGV
jgi:hypothetical protein